MGNRKRDCAWGCTRDNHHLRKSADRRAQISPVSVTNAYLISAFRSADFLRWCLSPERNLTHNLFFYVQSFLVLIWFIFSMRRRTVQPEIRSFISSLRSRVTPFDRSKTKKWELFLRVPQRFWQLKVWTQRHSRWEKLRCNILARKSAKLIANFNATNVTSLPSHSLSLSLYLFLSPSAPQAQ